MITLTDLGGIQVHGPDAEAWLDEEHRSIDTLPVVFDSDDYYPHTRDLMFVFPANRGQDNYQIHLLTNGNVAVLKEDRVFICTVVKNRPQVINFLAVPSHLLLTRLLHSLL
jgi:hypothetical protein